MNLDDATLKAAHKHCSRHHAELAASDLCGCFYCCSAFKPAAILDWISELVGEGDKEHTALCPKCGIDAVIGDKSGYPLWDQIF